jgi:hypothetical protein
VAYVQLHTFAVWRAVEFSHTLLLTYTPTLLPRTTKGEYSMDTCPVPRPGSKDAATSSNNDGTGTEAGTGTSGLGVDRTPEVGGTVVL